MPVTKQKKVTREAACVDPESLRDCHKTYFRASQVERSLRYEEFKVGLRVAVLHPLHEFSNEEKRPEPVFYTGTVVKIWGSDPTDQICTIEYDSYPWGTAVSFGIRQHCRFIIPIPQAKGKERIIKKKIRTYA